MQRLLAMLAASLIILATLPLQCSAAKEVTLLHQRFKRQQALRQLLQGPLPTNAKFDPAIDANATRNSPYPVKDLSMPPFNAIGLVQNAANSCVGVLVASNIVMASNSCLPIGTDYNGLTFTPGFSSDVSAKPSGADAAPVESWFYPDAQILGSVPYCHHTPV